MAWRAYGKAIMQDWPRHRPGFRPWAYWEWEVGEHPEDREAEILLLAARGLLFKEEIAALAERRTWARIEPVILASDWRVRNG